MTDLASVLEQVGRGRALPADGAISFLPAPRGTVVAAVLGFTGHHLIAADLDRNWMDSWFGAGQDVGRPMRPDFLAALGEHLQARPGGQDVLLVAEAVGAGEFAGAGEVDPLRTPNPRVVRAQRYRDAVRVATVCGGLVTAGRGLAGRWEISIEVEQARRDAGIGRALAAHGRTLVPLGQLVWAQVHPSNVASLRAFLAAEFRPVGAEVLFTGWSAEPR